MAPACQIRLPQPLVSRVVAAPEAAARQAAISPANPPPTTITSRSGAAETVVVDEVGRAVDGREDVSVGSSYMTGPSGEETGPTREGTERTLWNIRSSRRAWRSWDPHRIGSIPFQRSWRKSRRATLL